jgi:hypothetical protein
MMGEFRGTQIEDDHGRIQSSLAIKADIQRRGSTLARIVILSVYGADTITEVCY